MTDGAVRAIVDSREFGRLADNPKVSLGDIAALDQLAGRDSGIREGLRFIERICGIGRPMLDAATKAKIDSARDILVGKVPDPKSQVEQITIALIYKFMDDMDRQSEEMGGKASFFTGRIQEIPLGATARQTVRRP